MEANQRKKKKKVKVLWNRVFILIGIVVVCILLAAFILCRLFPEGEKTNDGAPAYAIQKLLDKNPNSRPGDPLTKVNNIVIHYVANPGTSATANRNYFNNLQNEASNPSGTQASSHFIVGLEGEVIQCIPLTEIAYANAPRNGDTVSIEVCHPDETGQFSQITYDSVVRLTADLCRHYNLTSEDVIRHFDITGKNCPKYYVENESAWVQFKADVATLMEEDARASQAEE